MSHADKYLKVLKAAGLGQIHFEPELGGGTHGLGVTNALGVEVLINAFGTLPEDDDEHPFGGSEWSVFLYDDGFLGVLLPYEVFDETPERWVEVIRGALGYVYSFHGYAEASDRELPIGFREIAAGHILSSLYVGIEENSNLQGASWEDFTGKDDEASAILLDAISDAFPKTGAGQAGVRWSDVSGIVENFYRRNPILSGDEAAEAGFGNFEEGLLGFLKFRADLPTSDTVTRERI